MLDKAESMSEALAAAVAPALSSPLGYTQLAKYLETSAKLKRVCLLGARCAPHEP